MLQVDQLSVRFGQRSFSFSVDVNSGEVVAVVGKSGSGKSTLLNLIGGFLQPHSGDIRWQGRSIVADRPDKRPVTSLFQSGNLFAHLSVAKNVGLGLHPGLRLDKEQWQRVEQALADVGLHGMGTRAPGSLSGGEQQRVALARCLAMKRPVLLLDEPYSALDSSTRESMLSLTGDVVRQNDLATVLVSHNSDDARRLSARVVTIVDGVLPG